MDYDETKFQKFCGASWDIPGAFGEDSYCVDLLAVLVLKGVALLCVLFVWAIKFGSFKAAREITYPNYQIKSLLYLGVIACLLPVMSIPNTGDDIAYVNVADTVLTMLLVTIGLYVTKKSYCFGGSAGYRPKTLDMIITVQVLGAIFLAIVMPVTFVGSYDILSFSAVICQLVIAVGLIFVMIRTGGRDDEDSKSNSGLNDTLLLNDEYDEFERGHNRRQSF
jgi:hypothetical protein